MWPFARRFAATPSLPSTAGSTPGEVASPAALDVKELHREHARFVWRSLQRLGVREADLEDAMQDVFVVVHRHSATFDGRSKITTWLFSICLRIAANRRRLAHLRREVADTDAPEPASASTPDADLEREQERAILAKVLDSLDVEKRAVLVMFELDGLSGAEIAEIMDVPLGTVQSRLFAARKDFQASAERYALQANHGRLPRVEGGRK